MAIKNKFCPRCLNIIRKNDTVCSECGFKIKTENKDVKKDFKTEVQAEKVDLVETKAQEDGGIVVDNRELFASSFNNPETKEPIKEENKSEIEDLTKEENKSNNEDPLIEENKQSEPQDNKFLPEEENVVEDGSINTSMVGKVVFEQEKTAPKRHKHKRKVKKEDLPKFTIDEDGSYNIDTSDVTYLEGVEAPTQSVRKARGDLPKEEKLKWWEIYKWADKMLARRKINKEVTKASYKIPYGIKKPVMFIWCILFGWLGIHNFYANNFKRGWTVVVSDVIIGLVMNIQPLYEFMGVFVGGGLGFVVLAMWFYDFFCLILNKYKYRISKEEFISNLNVETRAKLNKKYIALDKAVFKAKEQARIDKLNKKKRNKINN